MNFPFPDSAAIWVQYFEVMVTQPPFPEFEWASSSNICISGQDTSVAGLQYKKVEQCGAVYMGALRQDNDRVYFLPADSVQECTLYDFAVAVGDTVHDVYADDGLAFGGGSAPNLMDMVVSAINVQGDGRRIIELTNAENEFLPGQVWIEGFGSPYGLFSQQNPGNVSGYWYGIACMSHLDTIWSSSPGGVAGYPGTCTPQYVGYPEMQREEPLVFPNPTEGIVYVAIATDPGISMTITDFQGSVVNAATDHTNGLHRINLGSFADGPYLLHLRTPDGTSVHKIIKNAGH